MTSRTSQPLMRLLTLLTLLLVALVMALPVTASAQTQLGSVTIKKLPTSLDTPGVHPVRFELTGGDLTAPLILYSDTDTVRFSDLTPGTYHARELATRTGDVARATSAAFTVTIPDNEGRVDVTAFPKPQPLTLQKSADVSTVVPGSRVTYLLDGSVPLPDTNGQLHRYVLHDALPEGLTPTGASSLRLLVDDRTIPLGAGVDYTVRTENNTVTATLTPAGLERLAAERAEHDDVIVRFAFGVRVSTALQPGTTLTNIGLLYPDGYPEDGDDSVISNEHVLPVTSQSGLAIPILPIFPGLFFPGSSGSSTPGVPGPTADPSPGDDSLSKDSPTVPGVQVTPERPVRSDALASTGASVLGTVALGAFLSLIGITFYMRGRRVN